MATPKEALAQVLQSLDTKNDKLWTDDGSPLVSEVQRLANDKTVTRAQINEALPGFNRVPVEVKNTTIAPASDVKVSDGGDAPGEALDAATEDDLEALSTDQMRSILQRRVRDAEEAVTAQRRATSDSRQEEIKCERRLTRAHSDMQRYFPPITAAANIKAHLEAQGRLAMEKAGLGVSTRSQVDISMERSNRRGWTRPTRPVQNVAGA